MVPSGFEGQLFVAVAPDFGSMETDESDGSGVDFEILYYGILTVVVYLLGNSAADWSQTDIEVASVGPIPVPWSPGLLFAGMVVVIFVLKRRGRA